MGTVWEREQCGEAAWRERQWNVDATHRVRCRGDGRRSVRQCDWADAAVQRGWMRAAFPPILSCRLASMSSLSAALMCAQLLAGAGLSPRVP